MKDIEKLREFFKKDRYIIKNGIEIVEICEEYAMCKAIIHDDHLNAKDVVQGGMIYTIVDFTFAVHANYVNEKAVTQSATISYIRPAKNCKYIYAKSEEITKTNHNCIYEVRVYNDKDEIVAVAQINGFIS